MTPKKGVEPTPIRPEVASRPKPRAGQWRQKFLEELASTCNVKRACQVAGISRQQAYRTRLSSQKFRQQWEDAISEAMELLVAAAYERAMTVSDTLMIFLLKAHDPARYRDRYVPRAIEAEDPGEPRRVRIVLDTTGRFTPTTEV